MYWFFLSLFNGYRDRRVAFDTFLVQINQYKNGLGGKKRPFPDWWKVCQKGGGPTEPAIYSPCPKQKQNCCNLTPTLLTAPDCRLPITHQADNFKNTRSGITSTRHFLLRFLIPNRALNKHCFPLTEELPGNQENSFKTIKGAFKKKVKANWFS